MDRLLKDRLLTTLQAMGLKEIINFDAFKINYCWNESDTETERDDKKATLASTASRKGMLIAFRLWPRTSMVQAKGGRRRKN